MRVYSVTGTVSLRFNDGDLIPVSAGDEFKSDWPSMFEKIQVITAAGAAAVVIYGLGKTQSSVGAGTGGVSVQSTSGDPESVLNANAGQWAYDSSTGALYINPASAGTTGWVNIIA